MKLRKREGNFFISQEWYHSVLITIDFDLMSNVMVTNIFRLLQSLCDDQQEEISFLRQEIESMKKEYVDRDIQNEMHVEQLNQEIDFLKKQMRKYVSSIQVGRNICRFNSILSFFIVSSTMIG